MMSTTFASMMNNFIGFSINVQIFSQFILRSAYKLIEFIFGECILRETILEIIFLNQLNIYVYIEFSGKVLA